MLIRCPQCDTEYEINDHVLTERGRKMKCTHCTYAWFQLSPMAIHGLKEKAHSASLAHSRLGQRESPYLDPAFDDDETKAYKINKIFTF